MSDETMPLDGDLPPERVLPFAFPVVDSALQTFVATVFSEQNAPGTKVQWRQISSGSTQHRLLTTSGQYIGRFILHAVSLEQTLITSEISAHYAAHGGSLISFLNVFADWLYARQETINALAAKEAMFISKGKLVSHRQLVDMLRLPLPAEPRRPIGRPPDEDNEWAREQQRLGRNLDNILPEYMQRQNVDANDPTAKEAAKDRLAKALKRRMKRTK